MTAASRAGSWKWWVTAILLGATAINYLDRLTLSAVSVRITREMELSDVQYGNLELAFGWAFAVGGITFGFLADRLRVRLLYPAVVACWSLAGIAAGFTHGYWGFLVCRVALGFFEAGHWPCSLKTTLAVLQAKDRTLGNSILQAGASLGAIIAPQVMKWILAVPGGSWRTGFIVVGVLGLAWSGAWFLVVGPDDLPAPSGRHSRGAPGQLRRILTSPRVRALVVLVVGINVPWHIWRVWMMKFLQVGRGYGERAALDFNSLYYLVAGIGCFAAGIVSVWISRRFGASPHRARRLVYAGGCILTSLGVFVPWMPAGPLLLAVILIVGAGSLALFPCYYSFVQEISEEHLGRVSGCLSLWVWAVTSPMHSAFGWLSDRTHSYDAGLLVASLAPWLGVVAMRLWWRETA